ncbi:dienelactone hydrolase family protein [Francisella philomiragia]|uniref:Chlorophyllase family protein n=2 Tax=Francisella philomiragia TaxID=28110 RepID=A0AAW3DCU7_9GAMM|nr:chlorophyllase family protein [Francisella philomiragia]MBK2254356.1 dienelactone hydrolase family protein [Francisella philomiragia]MBK2272851.1 dienelactone hydrolase family protein [Francisella philomiragia]MBK2276510.1 dienelactone hydrolase family protein [Francisella philomiragia]MBK2281742.1 dienelactone hydrolase family protein [Francisella philomiragia]
MLKTKFSLSFILFSIFFTFSMSNAQDSKNSSRIIKETANISLNIAGSNYDIFYQKSNRSLPVVIVVHGFSRSKDNMSGWGSFLADHGYFVVVPNLPFWANHSKNAEFISELINYIYSNSDYTSIINNDLALVGFSAGGLATLIATSENTRVKLWIGLDPVDVGNLGSQAAKNINCPTYIIAASASACNANNNYKNFITNLKENNLIKIDGAVHVDAEWPTNRFAELFCGRSTQQKRERFHDDVLTILDKSFKNESYIQNIK